MYSKTTVDNPRDFTLLEASIGFPEMQDKGTVVDVKNVVIELNIYEHIDKSYLTGDMIISDAENLYSFPGFYGVEKLKLRIRQAHPDSKVVEKNFYIDTVTNNTKTGDSQTILKLHFIEDLGYLSEFINVNKAYYEKAFNIIGMIALSNFNKELSSGEDPADLDGLPMIKVIVPNMTPIRAMEWIKDRMSTVSGVPFYLFSTLVNDKLHLLHLETLLTAPPINTTPFRHSTTHANRENLTPQEQAFTIENYSDLQNSNILALNGKGLLNGVYHFHDVTNNRTQTAGNRSDDMERWTVYDTLGIGDDFKPLFGSNETKKAFYPVKAKLPERLTDGEIFLHEHKENTNGAFVMATDIYGDNAIYHYSESRNPTQHRAKINSKAYRNWLVSQATNFTIPGYWFLTGVSHNTIGCKIKVDFLVLEETQTKKDKKKSGEYLIYAARHNFIRNIGYTVHLSTVKVRDESELTATNDAVAQEAPI